MDTNKNKETSLFCATALYPNEKGASFDFEHYSKALIPLYLEILGDNCVKYEIRRGLAAPGTPAPPFICIANFWVKSMEKFGASMATPGMKDVMTKFSTFTDIQPIRQFDEVVA